MCSRIYQQNYSTIDQSLSNQSISSRLPISKKDFESPTQKIRIIQNNLVFVNGLPLEISNFQTLASPLYFGRYGFVQKIIFSSTHQSRKNPYTQAYITYSNPIQASLAIAALDGFQINTKALKVSYGTTKYCAYFIKGYQCLNKDCYYLHQLEPQNELLIWDSKQVFKKQTNIALSTVTKNIQWIIANSISNPFELILEGFPTISEAINNLCIDGSLSQELMQIIKQIKIKYSIEENQQIDQKQYSSINECSLFQQIQQYWAEDKNQLLKNNSFSTLQSPSFSDNDQGSIDHIQYVQSQSICHNIHLKLLNLLNHNNWVQKSKMEFCKDSISLKSIKQCLKVSSIIKKELRQQDAVY